jgi:hypothetical protein
MDEKTYQNLIKRKHPDYDAKAVHWAFLNETYESPRGWFQKNLFKFVREGDATYAGRLERAYRFNHTREVVDLVNKYLFKHAPGRNPNVPEEVLRFRSKATLSGLSLEQFERQVARKASIYGRVYVVLDNNAQEGEIVTKADEKKGNVRLYAYIVTPEQMKDCGFDKDGNYNWILIEEKHRDDDDPFDSTGDVVSKYRLWTKDEWYLFASKTDGNKEQTVELEDYGHHGLGVVPVIKCDHIESDNKYAVPALIEDIAYLDRTVANYCSNLDQIINDQTFSQLTLPASGLLSGISSTISTVDPNDPDVLKKRQEIINLGTSQILLYDGENGSPPAYISPDPKQAELIITTIKQIINERTKQDNSMGIDNSSGVAKAFDFERVNALLSAKANSMQAFSNRLENMVRIYHGASLDDIDESEINVEYSTNFDVRGLNDELAIANQFSLLAVPMELRRIQLKDIVDKMYPMLEDAERKKIESAIDKWEDALTMGLPLPGGQNKGTGVDKSDPMGKNTTQGFPGKKPDPSKN